MGSRGKQLPSKKVKVIEKLFHAIAEKDFSFGEDQLASIEREFTDEKVSGWVFAYRAYSLPPNERNEFLRANLHNENPRIREQVCDIVGDEFIGDLRGLLMELFNDPVDYVAEAARYNHDEMFDA
jgi:hypothetical protein